MMLHELTQVYAVRARQFSETVARLGTINSNGPDLVRLMRKIKRRRALCDAASAELDRYIAAVSSAAANSQRES